MFLPPSIAGYPRRSTSLQGCNCVAVRAGRTVLPAFHDLIIVFRLLGMQILQLLLSCRCEAAVNQELYWFFHMQVVERIQIHKMVFKQYAHGLLKAYLVDGEHLSQ